MPENAVHIYEESLRKLPQLIDGDTIANTADRKAAERWLKTLQRAKQKNWNFINER